MSDFGPNAHLAAISYDWNQFCINRVHEVIEGTWQSTDTWGGTDGPAVRLTNFNRKRVQPDVIAFIQTLEDGIQSGKIHPFSGPIHDNLGNLTVENDNVPTDAELLGLNWFARRCQIQIRYANLFVASQFFKSSFQVQLSMYGNAATESPK